MSKDETMFVGLRVHRDLHDRLSAAADAADTTISELARQALVEFLVREVSDGV